MSKVPLPRRFSLRSLLLLVLLIASGFGLWWRWEPWVKGEGLTADTISLLSFNPTGVDGTEMQYVFYHRRRPEYWWGIAWLPEFWLTLVFGVGLVWSAWRDWRGLGAKKKKVEGEVKVAKL